MSDLDENFALDLAEVERCLRFVQPHLEFLEEDDHIFARGQYVVSDGPHKSGPLDTYQIMAAFPKAFPNKEPAVAEIGNRIPRVPDRHMYSNGCCCLCVWEEWLAKHDNPSFSDFCEGPLHNFFLSQTVFEKTGKWPFDERSHGAEGVAEGIGSVLGKTLSVEQASAYASAISSKQLKGHWACPCGSGKKLRDCHIDEIRDMKARYDGKKMSVLQKRLRDLMKRERNSVGS